MKSTKEWVVKYWENGELVTSLETRRDALRIALAKANKMHRMVKSLKKESLRTDRYPRRINESDGTVYYVIKDVDQRRWPRVECIK